MKAFPCSVLIPNIQLQNPERGQFAILTNPLSNRVCLLHPRGDVGLQVSCLSLISVWLWFFIMDVPDSLFDIQTEKVMHYVFPSISVFLFACVA